MRTALPLLLTASCVTMLVVGASALADDESQFVDVVQPLLELKCVSCHGAEKQEGGLRLDSLTAAKTGGEQGPAIVPGDVAKSLLVKAITFRDPDLQMPPKQKLTDKQIALLTQPRALAETRPSSPRKR